MRTVDLIEKKRDNFSLTSEEVHYLIQGYTIGTIPDYQMSALFMAIFFNDMTDGEIADLTTEIIQSGEQIDLSSIHGVKVDKHSTGGVGDTTTLVLAPLMACLGIPMPKISGRGLGHTGGTIDKLESIPGFTTELSTEQFIQQVNTIGVAITGQSGNLTPADKKLYALRDVTATVDSVPLIASSVMSKKIAAGADAIVLDVTTGDGAFMKEPEDARRLAKTMVKIGHQLNKETVAIISDMSQPLGEAVGNSLEVIEAIECLRGDGPKDLMEIVYSLGSNILILGKQATSFKEASELMKEAIDSGKALEKFKELIEYQNGDPRVIASPELLPIAQFQIPLLAWKDGVISHIKANAIGIAAMMLGAGRMTKEDTINYGVGIKLHKKVGALVQKGDALLTIYSNSRTNKEVEQKLHQAISIGKEGIAPALVHDIITN